MSIILTGLKVHLSAEGRGRGMIGGDAGDRIFPPTDRCELLFGNGRMLDLFSVARYLQPCEGAGVSVPFRAEVG